MEELNKDGCIHMLRNACSEELSSKISRERYVALYFMEKTTMSNELRLIYLPNPKKPLERLKEVLVLG